MIKKIAFVGKLMAAVGLVCATGTAGSDNYAGVVCFKDVSSGTLVPNWGTVYNDSTTNTLTVKCPIVRRNTSSTVTVDLAVLDRHASQDIQCTFCNEYATGSGLETSNCDSDSSSGSGAGKKTISINGVTDHVTDEYGYVACTIPPKSGGSVSHIVSLRVTEP